MRELGVPVTPLAIAQHYAGLIDAMLVDERDAPADLGIAQASCDTLMLSLADRARVASAALELAQMVRK